MQFSRARGLEAFAQTVAELLDGDAGTESIEGGDQGVGSPPTAVLRRDEWPVAREADDHGRCGP
jgi:hypothetical protein